MSQCTNSIALRNFVTQNDVESVRTLVHSTHFFNSEEIKIAADLVQSALDHGDTEGYFFFFSELKQFLTGFVCYGPIPGTQNSFDIYWIAVAPKWQHRGIGYTLINAAESDIQKRDGKCIYIETSGRETYAPTRTFYERCGYKKTAVLPHYYAPDDAKLIYSKHL